jgi:peptidoglycan/xylan/chitin deacetylase (PgdA/CDA1 family)
MPAVMPTKPAAPGVCPLALLALAGLLAGACSSGGGGSPDAGPDAPVPFTSYPEIVVDAGPDAPAGMCDLGPWTGKDKLAPSTSPPCGLMPAQVPMFVSIGWDDNGNAEGMNWAVDMLKARSGTGSFYMTSGQGGNRLVVEAWRNARANGHEIGNHTDGHFDGKAYTAADWERELTTCNTFLTTTQFVVPKGDILGFRSPFLSYNDAMLATVQKLGFQYDCSIEEGLQPDADGTNYYWPYTLDNRSPGHTVLATRTGSTRMEIEPHPGLWELPVYAVIVPPDSECPKYGVPAGLRAKLAALQTWFAGGQGPTEGKITGFDYNLWVKADSGGFALSKAELVATLKYSLDLRLKGNRAPFLFGAHTGFYLNSWNSNAPGAPTADERRAAIEEFLDYARSKPEVRITSARAVLEWMRNPRPN